MSQHTQSLSHRDQFKNVSIKQSHVFNIEPINVLSYECFGLFGPIRSWTKYSLTAQKATVSNSGNLHKSNMATSISDVKCSVQGQYYMLKVR